MPAAGGDGSVRDAGSQADEDADVEPADAGTPDAGAALGPNGRVCSSDGFCWEQPFPQGETLRAAWAAAPDDVWAVGDHGLVLRYDGAQFHAESVPTDRDLYAVHGSGPDDVWVVGQDGVALHYDGATFTMHALGELIGTSDAAMTGALYGVFALAPDAAWAVGYSGVAAVILHYDGERWENQSLELDSDKPLRAIWGLSRDALWAVGDGGVIRSFDGTQWNVDKSPTGAALTSVHGLARHDVWAVGDKSAAVHWNGATWSTLNKGLSGALQCVRVDIAAPEPSDAGVATPQPMDAGPDAGPVAPMGPWSVWAFGAAGQVFRYNGSVWAQLPSGTTLAFYGAARVRQGQFIAVGEGGQLVRFEGDARQSLSLGARHNYLALWGDGSTLYAVGDDIERRDASGWAPMQRPTERSLYGVWGDGGSVWAVGTAGTVVRYEQGQGQWQKLQLPAAGDTWLRGVWGAGDSLWIVGHSGLALVAAGGGFLKVATPVRSNLLDVWGDAADHFWAVGEGGIVLRWDGSAWLKVPTGPMGGTVQGLRAVWGSGSSDVWVAGTESTILHWTGDRFEDLSRGGAYSINAVWGRSPSEIYFVGTGGVALRYDGSDFQQLQTGTHSALQGVFGDAQGRVFAVGIDGVALVLDPDGR